MRRDNFPKTTKRRTWLRLFFLPEEIGARYTTKRFVLVQAHERGHGEATSTLKKVNITAAFLTLAPTRFLLQSN